MAHCQAFSLEIPEKSCIFKGEEGGVSLPAEALTGFANPLIINPLGPELGPVS